MKLKSDVGATLWLRPQRDVSDVTLPLSAGGRVDAERRRDRGRFDAYLGLGGAAGGIQEGGHRPHSVLLVHGPGGLWTP